MREGAKRILFGLAGPGLYARLHAWRFRHRLRQALASPRYAESFFGPDLLAFAAALAPGQTVLDIGAFLGGSTALFCRAVGPAGRVIAFEPVHHQALSALVKRLRWPARIEALALSESTGPAELVIPVRHGVPLYSQAGFADSYAAAAAPGSGYSFQRQPTRRSRLDDWMEQAGLRPQDIGAIKIDVEGSEMGVFRGGERFFRAFKGPLLCEFWFDTLPPPGWAWLRERGYHCRYLGKDGAWRPADTAAEMTEAARGETYGNFLLQRE
ncbi:MAG: FkbM family methyltransferase [Fibrobacteres bacterium]|nr:FkbM family methyltransferase [Fibrobacterota bacterium]